MAQKKRAQQRCNMCTVGVGIGENADLAVTQIPEFIGTRLDADGNCSIEQGDGEAVATVKMKAQDVPGEGKEFLAFDRVRLAQLDDVATAVTYVDRVRQRPSTNLPPMASSDVPEIAASVNSKAAFLKRLQMERALELSLESVRWIDLRRWGLLETQQGINELISRDADFENFELGNHHILPLPQFEVDNNPNLNQNPNY